MRKLLTLLPIATLVVGFLAIGIVHSKPKPGQTITVRVLRAKVMKAPRFIGASSGSVSRGAQLKVVKVKGDWYKVEGKNSSVKGWIHRTNVVDKKVKLSSQPGSGGSGGATRDEVELAGRGFTPQVEEEYRSKNPRLDFRHVDAIEALNVEPELLQSFVDEGKLEGAR